MPYFVINGKPDCPNFVHAIYVAQYLADKLPNFVFKKVEKLAKDWAVYLEHLNKENTWYITESPLIWKEINMWGGKKYLIGGLAEFWEHVYCYYGLESLISKQELEYLAEDNLKFFLENSETARKRAVQVITILGASNPQTCFLINELVEIKELWKSQGMVFKLFDYYQNIDSKKYETMQQYASYLNESKIFGKHDMVFVCETKTQVMQDADIVINIEEFSRHDVETEEMFLRRCYCRMDILAGFVNSHNKRSTKIIMANNGPVCFLTSCLSVACRSKKFKNIVAITADKGFPYIKSVSAKTGVPVSRISAPAVWGFVGTNHFVDVRNIIYKADMRMPFKRSLTSPKGSTLPLGIAHAEIRMMSYLLKTSNDITNETEDFAKELQIKLRRPPIFSKVRAITSLLKLWTTEEIGDEIISLGVCSDGSFGIPKGVVFSQPVKMDRTRRWTPFRNFPLMNEVTKSEIKYCCNKIHGILEQYKLLEVLDHKKLFETEEEYDAYEKYLSNLQTNGEQFARSDSSDRTF
ncbi:putative malate dehydrogenase 1B isoform X1 [Diorhabda carinulata]|uniref:putative malate dehydrogenase 1B isoform X1 n=2 Tax=Diorhabda carinulata TaxID=1163345 RepID=UPI0025A00F55|nr:putative malate dehydrogenase 1B isoform X1 [Diorhabda carinulata]